MAGDYSSFAYLLSNLNQQIEQANEAEFVAAVGQPIEEKTLDQLRQIYESRGFDFKGDPYGIIITPRPKS